MIRYEAKALQELADKLYGQAAVVVAGSAVAGVVTGGLFSYAAALIFHTRELYLLPGAAIGGVIGFFVGRQRARAAKLQAQVAACLIQIEENTRRDKTG